MDFLRSCSTNLYAVEGYSTIEYQIYTAPQAEQQDVKGEHRHADQQNVKGIHRHADPPAALPWAEERHSILLDLRQRGVLVQSAAIQKKICVFGGFQAAADFLKSISWTLALAGRVEMAALSRPSSDSKTNITNQNIYGMFLSAVEESLNIALGPLCRAIRVAHLTWIVPTNAADDDHPASEQLSPDPHSEYALLTLRTQVTATGSLMLMPEVLPTKFEIVDTDPDKGNPVLLAPSGALASVAPDTSISPREEAQMERSKTASRLRRDARARLVRKAKDDGWKALVKSRLSHTTAVPKITAQPDRWTKVTLSTQNVAGDVPTHPPWDASLYSGNRLDILWPTDLCFQRSQDRLDLFSLERRDPTRLPSTTYVDPLVLAEQWFLGHGAREEAALAEQQRKTQAEADMIAAAAVAQAPPDPQLEQAVSSSPVNIRTQDHNVANGIYPTPPDWVFPGTSLEILSSTTPGDATGPATTEDVQVTRQPSDPVTLGLLQMGSRKNSTDELFGDADGDEEMFGAPDNDVTDADFNFFDDAGAERGTSTNQRERTANSLTSVKNEEDLLLENVGVQDTAAPTLNQDASPSPDGPPSRDETFPNPSNQPSLEGTDQASVPESQRAHFDTLGHAAGQRISTPPLSPFQIKERLLPSPIPASSIRDGGMFDEKTTSRRSSSFNPVVFNRDINSFDAKYRNLGRFSKSTNDDSHELAKQPDSRAPKSARSHSIIDLPLKLPMLKHKGPNSRRLGNCNVKSLTADEAGIADVSESATSYESDSESNSSFSMDEDIVPPVIFAKRKRPLADDGPSADSPRTVTDIESDLESTMSEEAAVADNTAVLDLLLSRDGQKDLQGRAQESQYRFGDKVSRWKAGDEKPASTSYWDLFDFTGDDLISIAQLVVQQNIGSDHNDSSELTGNDPIEGENDTALLGAYSIARDALKQVFSGAADCDFNKLVSIVAAHAEQMPTAKTQLRPSQTARRANGGLSGPQQLFALQTPTLRIQRGGSDWEMLPTSLKFWDALGLEPAGGPKNVMAYAIYPEQGDSWARNVQDFLNNVGLAYENCKFGRHQRGPTYTEYHDGLVPYTLTENMSFRTALDSIRNSSVGFGDVLRDDATFKPDTTIVIYIFDPFSDESMKKYLCGCFWALQQAYLDGVDAAEDTIPEFILQIIPVDKVALEGVLLVPEGKSMSSIACQIYDRIPCKRAPSDPKSVWRIPSAPSIQLVAPLPRKINFALLERPPKSLLEEAQILHLSYAINTANTWLTAAWSDNTGRFQFNTSLYIKNTEGKAMLGEIRDMTLSMATTATTWRIFVARVGTLRQWEKEVWKEQVGDNRAIILLDIDTSPTLHISATDTTANYPAIPQAGAGFMTPATTPQPLNNNNNNSNNNNNNNNITVSPDAHGGPAPSTPIANDSQSQQSMQQGQQQQDASATAAADPDACLVDTSDESWGMVLPFSALHGPYELKRTLASGLLLKRGNNVDSSARGASLPSLGVDIIDILMPKVAATVDGNSSSSSSNQSSAQGAAAPSVSAASAGSGSAVISSSSSSSSSSTMTMTTATSWLAPRSPEAVLREILSWYRGLGLLARLRGLDDTGVVPWHIIVAARGAEGLEGFMD